MTPQRDEQSSFVREGTDELTDERRRRGFARGVGAAALSVCVHAILIVGVMMLIGPTIRSTRSRPIRVTLLASRVTPGETSLPAPTPTQSPPRTRAEKHVVAPPHPIPTPRPTPRPKKTRRIRRRRPVAHPRKASARNHVSIPTPEQTPSVASTPSVTASARASLQAPAASLPVPAKTVAHPPRVLSKVLPEYPLKARLQGVTGRVVLEIVLGRDGSIRSVRVLRSVRLLDQAAILAVRQWRFSPARDSQGRRVSVVVDIPMVFTLGVRG